MTKHEIPSEGMTASNQDLSHSATGTSIKATTTDPIKVSTTFSSTTSPMQVTSSEVAPEDLYNPGYAYPGNPHLKDNKDPGTSDSGKGKMDADSLTKQKKDSEKVTSSKEGSSLLPPISPTQETLTKADKGNNAAFELKDDFALQNLDTPSNNNPLFSPTKGKSPEIHSDLNDLDALLFSDEDFSKGPSGNRKGRALNGFKKGAPPADSTSITSGISSASHSVKPIISGKPTIPPSILSTLTSSSTVLSTIIPSQPSDPRNSNKGSTKAIKTSVSLSSTVLSTIIPSQPSDPRNSNKGSTKVIKNSVSLSSTVLPTIFPSRTSDPRILNKDSTKVIKNSITSSYSRQPLKPGITEAPVVRTDLEQSYTPKTPTVRKNSNKQEKKNIKPNNSVPLNDPSNRHVALLPASGASSPEKDRKEKFSPSSSFSSNQPRPVVQDQKNKMPDQKPLKQRGPLNSFNSGPTTPMVKNNKNGIGSTQPPSNNRSNSFGSGGITPIVKNNSNRISSGPPPPPPNKKVAGANASHI
ncbi:hypothetical protein HMI55_000175 [Coelomomyces lativittatus]|nr:hypothetical protein HMI55_000175 [Coelomomyces lativittatus]